MFIIAYLFFSEEMGEGAEEFVEGVFGVVGGGAGGGDTPEVEGLEAFGFGVEDGGGEHAVGGGEVPVGLVGGGLHVEAGA